jgi:hypothetical protein
MKITGEMIRKYCEYMNYELEEIGKIAFSYKKPDGSRAALLKAAAAPSNIRK